MEPGDDWQLTERVRASVRSGKGDPFAAAVRATRMAMIITDPRRLDNPIIYANDAFLRLTGYTRLEVTGRNCRFLQGPGTDFDAVARIRAAIDAERDVHEELLNYRKDGSTFHNALYISPVHDEDGTLLFYFASQFDVSERHALAAERDRTQVALDANALLLREIGHRARNDLQMISAMLTLQSGNSADPAVRAALGEAIGRIDALSTLYRQSAPPEESAGLDLGDLVREIAETLVEASGRRDIALALDLAPLRVRPEAAGPLALIVNEVVSNAVRHAFPSRAGRLTVRIARDGADVTVAVEDDGIGPSATGDGSFEATLIDVLSRQVGGTIRVRPRDPAGTAVELRFPAERIGV
ncbi:PAS domain-containing protein [Methylorubrum extorquens]|uniref:PAS domain-containing protein n=1 Tax=Methylorubrum extorquens TaxID=408 RepID=A0AAX3WCX0_METEX|nr:MULTISPECIES: PAS domain-containing protein [Methylobacteriaceae]KQO96164.1 histidine kinase [Methylobacterium sp. Leaf92]KQQ06889.1 histidine kinase [Methylobacterium sp. Leaf122]WHQ68283.1 PAS domain-containing protein [Methylorubrum extorquens]